MGHLKIAYYVITLLIGINALSFAIYKFRSIGDNRLKYFILFFGSFTIIAVLNLISTYLKTNILFSGGTAYSFLRYIENPVSLILLMYSMSLFVHSLVPLNNQEKRNLYAGILAISLLLINYSLSLFFPYSGVNDFRILFKDIIFILVVFYCSILLLKEYKNIDDLKEREFTRKFALLFAFFIPGIITDTFFLEVINFKTFPIIYCLTGIMFSVHFFKSLDTNINKNNSVAIIENPELSFPVETLKITYSLSAREIEVAELLIKGISYIGISEKLFISVNTVKTHLRKTYQKLNVKNRLELAELIKKIQNSSK